ncbi:Uncharacterized conserved protein [Janthinobacterium sp. Marseille]|nr:glycosyltransferase [Janthinobacterium sp. Marseille]ABR91659.1 Uncharacterized conserved protein [Janthinobacterium sp. Marseille]
MRLLIVSYSYFPALTPRAFRWTAIAEWMVLQGHHVDVVCAKSAGLADFQVIAGVSVHRAGGGMRESLKTWLNRKPVVNGVAPTTLTSASSRRGALGRGLKYLYSFTLQKIMWPDFAGAWYFPALRKSRGLIEQHQPDVIISVSVPFTGHLVGLSLQKRYGIRWLADIGDPFSFMTQTPVNNHRLFNRLNYYSETKVLQGANVVSVTTEGTKAEYCQHFPSIASSKIFVIPPLFAAGSQLADAGKFFSDDTKIRLVFAGTLYSRIRNPSALLSFFKAMLDEGGGDKLELHFFGAINDCEFCFEEFKSLIGTKIFLHGLVAREDALRAMKEADILINLGNGTPYQLPSKVVEYVMLAKPVLNISPIELDSSQDMLLEFKSIFSVSEHALSSDASVYAEAKRFIENPPAIDLASIERFSERHSINRIGESYVDLLSAD